MNLVRKTLADVPIGGHFYGIASRFLYKKLSDTEVRSEDGLDKGVVWMWPSSSFVLVKAKPIRIRLPEGGGFRVWIKWESVKMSTYMGPYGSFARNMVPRQRPVAAFCGLKQAYESKANNDAQRT